MFFSCKTKTTKTLDKYINSQTFETEHGIKVVLIASVVEIREKNRTF